MIEEEGEVSFGVFGTEISQPSFVPRLTDNCLGGRIQAADHIVVKNYYLGFNPNK